MNIIRGYQDLKEQEEYTVVELIIPQYKATYMHL